jgi:hypothetical protein
MSLSCVHSKDAYAPITIQAIGLDHISLWPARRAGRVSIVASGKGPPRRRRPDDEISRVLEENGCLALLRGD